MWLRTETALSSVDGRYRKQVRRLAYTMSEYALMRARVRMEVLYLIALSDHPGIPLRRFTDEERKLLHRLTRLRPRDVEIIKQIETKGYRNIKATNHDVAAMLAWLRLMLKGTSLEDAIEWIHLGLTSEDCNNIAYAFMLRRAIRKIIYPQLKKVEAKLEAFAQSYSALAMLARTHGQEATPTTLGKEFKVFLERIRRQLKQVDSFGLLVKLNGASGNYCAHVAAHSEVDWVQFTNDFVMVIDQGEEENKWVIHFEPNLHTTQIEPHDTYAELFQIFSRINTILLNCCKDIWRYISDHWLVLKAVAGEVGSSAMPQKVNPIDFENAEGNLGLANAIFGFFAQKLPESRLQRDLSDSTVERNFGYSFGLCLIAYMSILKGFGKIAADEAKIKADLDAHPEVLAEAIQTVLRREGVMGGYDILKDATRGRHITLKDLHALIRSVELSHIVREELLQLEPWMYTGLAERLTASY